LFHHTHLAHLSVLLITYSLIVAARDLPRGPGRAGLDWARSRMTLILGKTSWEGLGQWLMLAIDSALKKIFDTNSKEIILECRLMFDLNSIGGVLLKMQRNFLLAYIGAWTII